MTGKQHKFFRMTVLLMVACCLLICSQAFADAETIATLEKELTVLVDQHKQLQTVIKKKKKGLDHLAAEIDVLKEKQQSGMGLIDKYRLQRLLTESLELSQNLDTLEEEKIQLENRILTGRQRIVNETSNRIDQIIKQLSIEKRKKQKNQLVQEYFQCRITKNRHRLDEPKTFMVLEFKAEELDTYEELLEKVALIRDFRQKIQDYIRDLDNRKKELEEELRLSQEIHQLMEQERLFEDIIRYPVGDPRNIRDDQSESETDSDDPETPPETVDPSDAQASPLSVIAVPLDNLFQEKSLNISIQKRLKQLERKKTFLMQAIAELDVQEKDLLMKAQRLKEAQ